MKTLLICACSFFLMFGFAACQDESEGIIPDNIIDNRLDSDGEGGIDPERE